MLFASITRNLVMVGKHCIFLMFLVCFNMINGKLSFEKGRTFHFKNSKKFVIFALNA